MLVWMNLAPLIAARPTAPDLLPLADALALSLVGAGCFMGGIVTAWIAFDLARLGALSTAWLAPGIIAGLSVAPSPFVLPRLGLLLIGLLVWLGWCAFLATRPKMPNAFTEWT
jgi:hypothetical protein